LDISTLGILVAILAALAGLIYWLWKVLSNHKVSHVELDKIPKRLDKIDDDLSALRLETSALVLCEQDRDPRFFEKLKTLGLTSGNPYDPARRNLLLDKYRQRTITLKEAEELKQYLTEDTRAASSGDVIWLLAALAGLAALVYLLTRDRE